MSFYIQGLYGHQGPTHAGCHEPDESEMAAVGLDPGSGGDPGRMAGMPPV